jgi:hypothetical protein
VVAVRHLQLHLHLLAVVAVAVTTQATTALVLLVREAVLGLAE